MALIYMNPFLRRIQQVDGLCRIGRRVAVQGVLLRGLEVQIDSVGKDSYGLLAGGRHCGLAIC